MERAIGVALAGAPDKVVACWCADAECGSLGAERFYPRHADRSSHDLIATCRCRVQAECLGGALTGSERLSPTMTPDRADRPPVPGRNHRALVSVSRRRSSPVVAGFAGLADVSSRDKPAWWRSGCAGSGQVAAVFGA